MTKRIGTQNGTLNSSRKKAGRPNKTTHELLLTTARTLFTALEKEKNKYNQALNLSADIISTPEGQAVIDVITQRLKAAEAFYPIRVARNMLLGEVRAARKNPEVSEEEFELISADYNIAEARSLEAESILHKLPPAGYTFEEWESLDGPKNRHGRPPLPADFHLVRAQEVFKVAIEGLHKYERSQGLPCTNVANFSAQQLKKTKVGRPKLDALGKLDAALKKCKKRLQDAERDLDEGIVPENIVGPRAALPAENVARFSAEIGKLLTLIRQKELELDGVGILNRQIKKLRDDKTSINKAIKGDDLLTELAKTELQEQAGSIQEGIEQLINKRKLLEGSSGERKVKIELQIKANAALQVKNLDSDEIDMLRDNISAARNSLNRTFSADPH